MESFTCLFFHRKLVQLHIKRAESTQVELGVVCCCCLHCSTEEEGGSCKAELGVLAGSSTQFNTRPGDSWGKELNTGVHLGAGLTLM